MNSIGVLAANANTEDVYSTVEQDSKSKTGANNESDEGSDMFAPYFEQNLEWSHGKHIYATNSVNWTTILTYVSLLKSRRSECKMG